MATKCQQYCFILVSANQYLNENPDFRVNPSINHLHKECIAKFAAPEFQDNKFFHKDDST